MANILLDNYKNDPAWAETIKLYSGLFDSQAERTHFIIELAESDILLAAECKVGSINNELEITSKINSLAISQNYLEGLVSASAIKSLYLINRPDSILKFLISYGASEKHHMPTFLEISNSNDIDFILEFAGIVIDEIQGNPKLKENEKKKLKTFLYWIIFNISISLNSFDAITLHKIRNICRFFETEKLYKSLLNLIYRFNLTENSIYTLDKVDEIIAILFKNNKFLDIYKLIEIFGLNQKYTPERAIENAFKEGTIFYIEQIVGISDVFKLNLDLEEIVIRWRNEIERFVPKKRKRILSQLENFSVKHNINSKCIVKNDENQENLSLRGTIVECTIVKIIPSHIFLKIKGDIRNASIYIGELSNMKTETIFDFEYNGSKLYIGQKIMAKVKGIDNQNRVNLTIKGI